MSAARRSGEPAAPNLLLFGDNLRWLRDRQVLPDESVDLVYLDPPFNSNADYNVLFKEATGEASPAQFHAFTDTWRWADAEPTYRDFIDTTAFPAAAEMMQALKHVVGPSPILAYVAMMAPRLEQLHRVLKPSGSLYLHCDPTASHYLRLLLDAFFSPQHFRNEISWRRSNPKSLTTKNLPNCRDVILRYSKTDACVFNAVYTEHDPDYVAKAYRFTDEDGRRYRLLPLLNPNDKRPNLTYEFLGVTRVWRWTRERMQQAYDAGLVVQLKPGAVPQYKKYLDESQGRLPTNDWHDIKPPGPKEALGYPTQKPLALLERIIEMSSNRGDLILDPFCGCGTTVHAAQKLGRRWVGIDITYIAINLIKRRLLDAFGKRLKFEERGAPTDLGSARRLAEIDPFQFQHWAISLIDARPLREGPNRGADRGVDGLLYFYEAKDERAKLIVQVKSGGVTRADIAALVGDVANQGAVGGIFLTLDEPTRAMRNEAVEAGRYKSKLWSPARDYPRIQILTIDGIISGKEFVDAPPRDNPFARAQREELPTLQEELLLEAASASPKRPPLPR